GQLSVFALALVFALSLVFSHFIAGPIYRFEKTVEAMRDGDLTIVVRLRPRDEFKELAGLFNEMLASLRLSLQTERDVVDAVLEAHRPLVRPLLIALVAVMQVARGRYRGAGAAGAEGGE